MHSKIVVLLADDSEDDVFLLKRAFIKQGVNAPFHVVYSGSMAIEYLAGHGQFCDRRISFVLHLLLLDIKMPGTDGFDVPKWVRGDTPLRLLPIIILSSSRQQGDIDKAHSLGANAYAFKPVDPADLQVLVEAIEKFWLRQHRFPALPGIHG